MLCLIFVVNTAQLSAAIKSNTGNIHFNSNNDSTNEMTLSSDGLGIGIATPTANLHVVGDAIVTGKLNVGSSSSASSTLQITGTLGYSMQTVTENVTLSDTSLILVDTSAANINLGLPDPTNATGRVYIVKKIHSNNELSVYGIIDNSNGYILSSGNTGYLNIISDGIKWWIMERSAEVTVGISTEWTSSDVSAEINTILWLDASDASTVTADGSGNVSQWNDKSSSGSGGNVSQATATKHPTTGSNTINGLNTIAFDGSNDALTGTGSGTSSGNWTLYIVASQDTGGSGYLLDFASGRLLFTIDTGGGYRIYDGSWSGVDSSLVTYDVPQLVVFEAISNGNIFRDGSSLSKPAWTYTARSLNSTFSVGSHNAGSASPFKGKIGEMMLVSGASSTAERQKLEGYLAHKWGLEVNLPSSHPYKSNNPQKYPEIISAIADDPNESSTDIDAGDTITLTFDASTNKPNVATKANIDSLVSFGSNVLGSDYSGAWNSDGTTLTITVANATGSNVGIGQTITILIEGNLTLSSNSSISIASAILSGDFGDQDWSPEEISTTLWLDASDSSTIRESGGSVYLWNDKSGSEWNVIQGTADKQPTSGSYTMNGLNTHAFDGTDDSFTGTGSGTSSGNWTMYIVAKLDSGGGSTEYLLDFASGRNIFFADGSGVGYGVYNLPTGWSGVSDGTITYVDQMLVFEAKTNGDIYRDGSSLSNPPWAYTARSLNSAFGIGSHSNGVASYFKGKIGEIVLVAGASSMVERQKLEGYLAHKWGLSGNLTSDHPYKSQRPMLFPLITSITANDPNGDFVGVDVGDNIIMVFDGITNEPAVGTKAQVDTLINFGGNVLGADYSGIWTGDGNSLVLTVDDASGNAMSIGQDITIYTAGNLTFIGNVQASSSNAILGGSFDP